MHRLRLEKAAGDQYSSETREAVIVSADTLSHINALRLRDHEEVEMVDFENGVLYRTAYRALVPKEGNKKGREAFFYVISHEVLIPDNPVIHLFQAKSKAAKHEFAAQKAVEIGIHQMMIFESDYAERGGDVKLERLRKIAAEAALQSKSPVLPDIRLIARLEAFDFSAYDKVLFFYENADKTLYFSESERRSLRDNAEIAVIIGSEGGFSEREVKWAEETFGGTYSLGERVLRTETATISAISIVKHEWNRNRNVGLYESRQ